MDSKLTFELFEQKFGGIENFAEEWSIHALRHEGTANPSRSSKTIYKWIANGMPKAEDTFLSFFGALDADPISLIDLEKSQFRKHFGRLRQAILLGGINIGGFRPLMYLLRPSPQWPDETLTGKYFRRRWATQDFLHEAEHVKNLDVTIRIQGDPEQPREWPRAFHVAYRRLTNADGLWRPFGTILTRNSEAILVHENGAIGNAALGFGSGHRIDFKTFFGPSPAEFRVASLHPFEATLDLYDDPNVTLQFAG
ncbi:hypothetical protein [Erythrobacter sp. AP23]|uniref:hypothetical protein n=1 Tax=Erythrobacter sp. AP23 TaxID=499656 RepID=UPI0012ECE11C|nr:hypothetical protein [Erythrobacter sp. AP23]